MQWMGSSEFLQSKWGLTDEGRYAHSCLSSLDWWDNLETLVNSVQPLYSFLRFADEDKLPNLSEVLLRYQITRMEYESLFSRHRTAFNEFMEIIDRRMNDLTKETLINAGNTFNLSCIRIIDYVLVVHY